MILDFIEIGTSDFDTEIQKNNNRSGISIDPIKYYLDKLPSKSNCLKLNVAISDYNGKAKVFYIPEEKIIKHNLCSWVKGCNSLFTYHPTVYKLCLEKGLDVETTFTSYEVDVKTLMTIILENNISKIKYLKIDTEGHDVVILKKFYEDIITHKKNNLLPSKILFA